MNTKGPQVSPQALQNATIFWTQRKRHLTIDNVMLLIRWLDEKQNFHEHAIDLLDELHRS